MLYGIGIALAPQTKRRFHRFHILGVSIATRVNLHLFFALMETDGMFSRLIDPAHNQANPLHKENQSKLCTGHNFCYSSFVYDLNLRNLNLNLKSVPENSLFSLKNHKKNFQILPFEKEPHCTFKLYSKKMVLKGQ